MIGAVVPVKTLPSAKSRLRPWLDRASVEQLAIAMLVDVLNRGSTTITTGARAGFIVVSTSTGDDDDNVATYGPKVGFLGAMFAVRQRIHERAYIIPEVSIYVMNADPAKLAYSASLGWG